MPELPDLEYIVEVLDESLCARVVTEVEVWEPIIIRMMVPGSFREVVNGESFGKISRRGPFVVLRMSNVELIVHLMLAGKFHLMDSEKKKPRKACFSLCLDNGKSLWVSDQKLMGKVYVTSGRYDSIPGYLEQGVDILSSDFTLALFRELLRGKRRNIRSLIMDQSLLSAIGNAYADEILFAAAIHPKTPCNLLDATDIERLFLSIKDTLLWAIREVKNSGQPIDVKVRDHMRVRNRRGELCRCGTTIRRTQIYGYDTFFCPKCQPSRGKELLSWS